MSDKMAVSRVPGFLERYYICRDTTGVMSRGFNISIRLNNPVSDVLLSNALRRVILSCPYLTVNAFRTPEDTEHETEYDCSHDDPELPGTFVSCEPESIISEDTLADGMNYRIHAVKKIRYSDVVFHKAVKTIDDSVLEDLSKIRIPVNSKKPMWYLSKTSEEESGHEYFTFASNHVVFDGRSAVHFFEDLVKALDAVSAEPSLKMVDILFNSAVDGPEELPDSGENITDLFDTPVGFRLSSIASYFFIPKFVSKWISSYLVNSSPNFYQYPPFKVVPFDGHNESKFRLLHFSTEEVGAILAQCKSQNSTLTPMMASILYSAINTAFTPHLGVFSQSCELMICGRRYYPEKERETRYGLFISAFTPYILPGSTIKEAASALSKGLLSAMENRSTFYRSGLLRFLNVWNYMKSFTEDKEVRNTFEISNLGRVNYTSGSWRVTDAIFSQGVTFAHITLSVISTPEGGMNISIAFHDKLLNISQSGVLAMDQCIEEFKKGLLGLE